LDPIAAVQNPTLNSRSTRATRKARKPEGCTLGSRRNTSAGQKYPLLFAGHYVGVVEVQAAVGITCETLTATLKGPVPLLNAQKALAASSIVGFNYSPELAPAKYSL
jgi:hypothetical protein